MYFTESEIYHCAVTALKTIKNIVYPVISGSKIFTVGVRRGQLEVMGWKTAQTKAKSKTTIKQQYNLHSSSWDGRLSSCLVDFHSHKYSLEFEWPHLNTKGHFSWPSTLIMLGTQGVTLIGCNSLRKLQLLFCVGGYIFFLFFFFVCVVSISTFYLGCLGFVQFEV